MVARIEVRGIGASEIRIGRRRITPATEVVFALAFYMCMRAGERVTRDEVVELFWGTADVVRGRHSLRQMLYKLRQRGFALDEEGEELFVDAGRVVSDVAAVLRESWVEEVPLVQLEAAYELIPGYTRAISLPFEGWLGAQRAALGAQHRRACLRHLAHARREGRWADLDRIALLMLRSDPLNEEATLARAESAAMIGSKALALEILDQYMEELGDKAVKIGLPATVLRRRISETTPHWAANLNKDAVLVGRMREMLTLGQSLESVSSGNGRSALVVGPPGVGKTRLASEVLSFARLRGFTVVGTRSSVQHRLQPYATAVALLLSLVDVRGAASCSPEAMALARRISTVPDRLRPNALAAPSISSDELVWALTAIIVAIAEESRLCLLVDDLHNCDSESLPILVRCVHATAEARCQWIFTSRRRSDTSQLTESTVLSLAPLAPADSLELATAFVSRNPVGAKTRSAGEIARASGGNPLFIRELSGTLDSRIDEPIPATLRSTLASRLARLNPTSTRLLRASALLGPHATVARLLRVRSIPSAEVTDCIEGLEHEGIVSSTCLGAIELHDCWTAAVTDGFGGASLAALAHDCADALREESREDNPLLALATANLFLRAGDSQKAAQALLSVAPHLLEVGLSELAREVLRETLARNRSRVDAAKLTLMAATSEHAAGRIQECAHVCDAFLQNISSESYKLLNERAQIRALRADCAWRLGERMAPHAAALLHDAQLDDLLPSVRHRACFWGLRVALVDSSDSWAERFIEVVRAQSRQEAPTVYSCLTELLFAAERGTIDEIIAAEVAVRASTTEVCSAFERVLATRLRATALRFAGLSDQVFELAERATDEAAACGFTHEAIGAALSACFHALDLDERAESTRWLDRLSMFQADNHPSGTRRSMLHARARALAQAGDFEQCHELLEETHELILDDDLRTRRSAEAALVHWCAAETGRRELAERFLSVSLEEIDNLQPSLQMDFVAELGVRTLRLLANPQRANELHKRYLSRRGQRRALPAFYSCLASSPRLG